MHRIDGAGATVDNKFTDGDPVGGIQATLVTDDWLNDVQEELMSILAAGAVTPVKGTQNQVLRAIRSLSAGVVGSTVNLKMTVATATASALVTADEIIVGAALGSQVYRVASYSKSINLATTGAGGMDTGAAPVNGWVALYAIFNPTSGVSSILAVNSPNALMPTVYGGANMPAGYTASALLTVVPTNAIGQFKPVSVKGRDVFTNLVTLYSGSASVANNPIAIAGAVPGNAVSIFGEMSAGSSGVSSLSLTIFPDASQVGQQNLTFVAAAGQAMTVNYANLPLTIAQQIMFTSQSTAGTPTYNIYSSGYRL
jgi:hypothetical protein